MAQDPEGERRKQGKNSDRRTCRRHAVSCRSAVWLDEGPIHGILGTIADVSTGGFSILLKESLPPALKRRATVYCVLLMQNAHIGCMARPVAMTVREDGNIQVGFKFEALSSHDRRLLSGVLQFLTRAKLGEGATCLKDPDLVCNPNLCAVLGAGS